MPETTEPIKDLTNVIDNIDNTKLYELNSNIRENLNILNKNLNILNDMCIDIYQKDGQRE